ncbi:MAG: DNA polymerase IV [Methanolinea sp.]|jgi:DNA polymerase IV (DinB-like DNA polymerase)|nr:DNA polymerase IV [Methanolinea sp.]
MQKNQAENQELPPGPLKHRIILHVDMDSFYASVEVREHPDLAGKPLVIGADPRDGRGRGVVCTCSYEARSYGVHSAMPVSIAYHLCPHAIFLSPRFPVYASASKRVMAILREYADRFQQVSIDEAYLDLSSLPDYPHAAATARQIKDDILSREHLTCSIGIGPGKTIAKIGSDLRKPGGLVVIPPEKIEEMVYPLPAGRIPGIGKKTGEALQQKGIFTIGDLAKADIQQLMEILGKWAVPLQDLARGNDDSQVREHSGSKSVSREITFDQDYDNPELILDTLRGMSRDLCKDLEELDLSARTITVKIRFFDFTTVSRARSLPCRSRDLPVIQRTARELALPLLSGKKVRLAGLRLSSLDSLDSDQKSIGDFIR